MSKQFDIESVPEGLVLPGGLADVDSAWMTILLRDRGMLSATNEVVSMAERDVGMTAGYFSSIKKMNCTFKEETDCPKHFICKSWPPFEIMPEASIASFFIKDMKGYTFPEDQFLPRPKCYLAAYDQPNKKWGLILEDLNEAGGIHKTHENEMNMAEVMRMIPKMVDFAVAWEGCHEDGREKQLNEYGMFGWCDQRNMGQYKATVPAGAKYYDITTSLESPLNLRKWKDVLPTNDISETIATKLDAFHACCDPANGATVTLGHGDFRGDNLFFFGDDDFKCIDFQFLYQGPVSCDLAYLMTSGSVLPEVYGKEGTAQVTKAFFDQFKAKTTKYKDLTYEQFMNEYKIIGCRLYLYFVGMGGPFYHGGAYQNVTAARIEWGHPEEVKQADGTPFPFTNLTSPEARQRMWWAKAYANFLEHIVQFDLYDFIKSCKEDEGAADANWGPPVPPRCSADMKINTKFLEVVDPPK